MADFLTDREARPDAERQRGGAPLRRLRGSKALCDQVNRCIEGAAEGAAPPPQLLFSDDSASLPASRLAAAPAQVVDETAKRIWRGRGHGSPLCIVGALLPRGEETTC